LSDPAAARRPARCDLGVRSSRSWNEYIFASTLLHDGRTQTITVWLSYLYGGNRFVDWGAIMAASTLIAIPVVIFFLLVQRRIAFGLTAGAVKA
jgi:N,N'-diacetylchitobiose transport system permease protein